MKKVATIFLISWILSLCGMSFASAQMHIVVADSQSYAAQMATTAMQLWPDSLSMQGDKIAKWRYDQGVILKGIQGLWQRTGDPKWFNYIQHALDFYVLDDGSIRGYDQFDYNLDNLNNGKLLLLLYQVTGKEKYKKAVEQLRQQLSQQPRTAEGSFWHKKIYTQQVWLDGLYMAQPFYAATAQAWHEDSTFNDIARQFARIEQHTRDNATGLLSHGWDASREQAWANKENGRSPNFWGRSMGWYGMAIVDALDFFPTDHPGRKKLTDILQRYAAAIIKVQDKRSGLWYDILDKPNLHNNYPEASASCMFVYTLAKAVRKGYLSPFYLVHATNGWQGILQKFVTRQNGSVALNGTVSVSGLGGSPYRDGSIDYYLKEPVVTNDPKGIGAFILAANEMELLPTLKVAVGKQVLLDYYFNNEYKPDVTGKPTRFHYTWDDQANSGFSFLGNLVNSFGARTAFNSNRPSATALSKADVFIIVDPDNKKETANPNIPDLQDAATISNWVKAGGVLILMGNDSGNNNIASLNTLAAPYGIIFNSDNFNTVEGTNFEQGAVDIAPGNPLFKLPLHIYVKEVSTLTVQSPATSLVTKAGKIIMGLCTYGKGRVFAIGDPWLYNEYLDGRRLPNNFQNVQAARQLLRWALTKRTTDRRH